MLVGLRVSQTGRRTSQNLPSRRSDHSRIETGDSLPGETIVMKFKLLDNISAVKGMAVERVKELLSPEALVDYDEIVVTRSSDDRIGDNPTTKTFAGEKLEENRMLVDFVFPNYDALTVIYPEGGITARVRQPSIEIEPDCFFMFDSDF